jgi:hypothetical protein
MKTTDMTNDQAAATALPSRALRSLSLRALLERIVDRSDRRALNELHNHRCLFRPRNAGSMRLVEFAEFLCRSAWAQRLSRGRQMILDRAQDLTIDKFLHLPSQMAGGSDGRRQTDCRLYFKRVLHILDTWRQDHPDTGPLQEEAIAARILQGRVSRAFRLSCLEARRSANPARSRYAWRVNGHVLYLWMPMEMPGRDRRTWLKKNVPDVDAHRFGENHRVQSIVDARLGLRRHVPLNESLAPHSKAVNPSDAFGLIEGEVSSCGLAVFVAEEKAAFVHEQRPAIGRLGPASLKRLVLQIFEELTAGRYEGQRLARQFGLSPATLSRFAGSRWKSGTSVPDLWRNVAQALAGHQAFADTARAAGVWPEAEKLTGLCPPVEEWNLE